MTSRLDSFSLTAKDFKLEWFSGTGAGGQHRNKHQNCCRITHLETGWSETAQTGRSRAENQREAFHRLARRLIPWIKSEKYGIYTPGSGTLKDRAGFGSEVVRTYSVPENRVTDHRTGQKVTYQDFESNSEHLTSMIEQALTSDSTRQSE
jgi:peptide chain release factor 1